MNRRSQKVVQGEVKKCVLQTPKSGDTAVKQEDETIEEDFLNKSPTVDLSGSSYFQFHQSMVKVLTQRTYDMRICPDMADCRITGLFISRFSTVAKEK